jgi:hypothetical protein
MDHMVEGALDAVLCRAERLAAAACADLPALLLCDEEVVELGAGGAVAWAPVVRDAVAARDPAACVLVCPGLRRPPTQGSAVPAPIVVLLAHDRGGRVRSRWAEVRSGGVGAWADVPWAGGPLAACVRAGYEAAAWIRST